MSKFSITPSRAYTKVDEDEEEQFSEPSPIIPEQPQLQLAREEFSTIDNNEKTPVDSHLLVNMLSNKKIKFKNNSKLSKKEITKNLLISNQHGAKTLKKNTNIITTNGDKEPSSCCASGKCTASIVKPALQVDKACSGGDCCQPESKVVVATPSCCSSGVCSKIKQVSEQPKESCCKSSHCSKNQSCSSTEMKKMEAMIIDTLIESPNNVRLNLTVMNLHCADCANMVEGVLSKKKGIINARVNCMSDSAQVIYDKTLIEESKIISTIQELGFPTTVSIGSQSSGSSSYNKDMLTVFVEFKQILDKSQEEELLNNILQATGISSASFTQNKLRVDYNADLTGVRDVKKIIEQVDMSHEFSITSNSKSSDITDENNRNEIMIWRRNLFVCFTLSLPVVFTSFIFPMIKPVDEFLERELTQGLTWYTIIGLIFSTPIQFYFGRPLYMSAYRALRFAKKPNMDTLVMLSTTVAYVYSVISTIVAMSIKDYKAESFFETSAMLLTFIILGRFLEILAKGQTSAVLTSILKLKCTRAIWIHKENNQKISCQSELSDNENTNLVEEEIDIELVQRGDILKVLPGSKVPTDGVVFYGTSSIDEAMISGESIPVTKGVGDQVFGSTINQLGTIHIRVTKTSSENTLSAIDKLIHESQNSKIPIQRIADLVSAYFIPIIMTLSGLSFVFWMTLCYTGVLTTDIHPVAFSLQFALSILVISCPCAISLSAPTAVMVGIAVGVKHGVLFKSGKIIEHCHKVNTIIFDKTGTLTNGKPVVTDCILFDETSCDERVFKSIIGSAELGSEHVLGKAIASYVENEHISMEQPSDYLAEPGKGLQCSVSGRQVLAGNATWMNEKSIHVTTAQQEVIKKLELEGKTVVHVAIDGTMVGIIALADTIKTESPLVINELKKRGMEVWVVSGDNETTTSHIAQQLGIENIMANVLPSNKKDKVCELQSNISMNGTKRVVAMIGDGINDSPSLAQADIGFGIGAGSDIALETADIILVKSDLRDVLVALDLSKTTFRRIKLNFLWAFLYNVIGIPLAAGALYPAIGIAIPPAIAGLSEIFSSIPVILFSLLLKFYRPPQYTI